MPELVSGPYRVSLAFETNKQSIKFDKRADTLGEALRLLDEAETILLMANGQDIPARSRVGEENA